MYAIKTAMLCKRYGNKNVVNDLNINVPKGALSSVVLLLLLYTRNMAWGILVGFLIATGGLSMGIQMLADWLNWGFLTTIFSVTISGASSLCTLSFKALVFLRVVLVTGIWGIAACTLNQKIILKKDI